MREYRHAVSKAKLDLLLRLHHVAPIGHVSRMLVPSGGGVSRTGVERAAGVVTAMFAAS